MGNVTTKSVGDFQANVGQFSGDLGVIMSYIFAGFLIIVGIVMAVFSFVPMGPLDCTKDEQCSTFGEQSQECKDETKRCNKKTKHPWLLLFLLLIPLAVLIVLVSKWWDHLVHTNKTAAQIGGTMFELQTAKDIFSN